MISGNKHLLILVIFKLKRVGEIMLPCGTHISWVKLSNMVVPIRALNSRSLMKFSTKTGRWPRRPDSCMSFTTPCFHTVSHTFSRWKKIDTMWSLLMKASRRRFSKRTDHWHFYFFENPPGIWWESHLPQGTTLICCLPSALISCTGNWSRQGGDSYLDWVGPYPILEWEQQ